MVTKNMGSLDSKIRYGLGALFALAGGAVYYWYGGGLGIAALTVGLVLAAVMWTTAATQVCPTYMPFGLSTRGRRTKPAAAAPAR